MPLLLPWCWAADEATRSLALPALKMLLTQCWPRIPAHAGGYCRESVSTGQHGIRCSQSRACRPRHVIGLLHDGDSTSVLLCGMLLALIHCTDIKVGSQAAWLKV